MYHLNVLRAGSEVVTKKCPLSPTPIESIQDYKKINKKCDYINAKISINIPTNFHNDKLFISINKKILNNRSVTFLRGLDTH